MKKIIFALLTLVFSIGLASCKSEDSYDIVVTMYTHYDFAKQIVGDEMSVKMLVPLGEGIHDFEATSQDMVLIENAKLFVYTSEHIDSWITDPNALGGDDTIILNMEDSLEHEHDETEEEHVDETDDHDEESTDEHHHDEDAHYWIDPHNSEHMIEFLLETIIEIDEENKDTYTANAQKIIKEIDELAEDFETYLEGKTNLPSIFVAGHNAFESLADHFGLEVVAVFDEFEPDAELTSAELVSFSNKIKEAQANYLYLDALESPIAATAIKENLEKENYDLEILTLYAYQNLTEEDFEKELTYQDLLERNINTFKIAIEG